jgi:hypothetical protein
MPQQAQSNAVQGRARRRLPEVSHGPMHDATIQTDPICGFVTHKEAGVWRAPHV